MQVMRKQQNVYHAIVEHIDPVTPSQQLHVLNVYLDLHKQNLAKDLAPDAV